MERAKIASFRCNDELWQRIESYRALEESRLNDRFGEKRIEIKTTSALISLILAGLQALEKR